MAAPDDFTGYWVLSKVEQLDSFLKLLGAPWVIRKAADKFATASCDIISHTGSTMRVTTLNPKGSWTRTYDTDHPVDQLNCEGVRCKTTTTWEGPVLHSKLEGSPLGGFESWRYRRGDTMVVKTSVKKLTSSGGGSGSSGSGGGGKEEVAEGMSSGTSTSCFWFFERMQSLQRHLGGTSRSHLLKALASDHTRVQQATRSDNAYLQKVMLDWNRWSSPADEFIHLPASPSVYSLSGGSGGGGSGRRPPFSSSTSRLRSRASPAGASSPMLTSQNPSTNSLVGMSGGGGGGGGASSASQDGILKSSRSPQAPATTRVPGEGEKGPILTSEISLMPQRGSSGENTTNATTNTAAAIAPHTSSSSDITFPVLSNPSSPGTTANTTTTDAGTAGAGAAAVHPPPPPPPPINPHHSRKYSMESATAAAAATVPRKALHYRSPSTESINLSQVTPCASQAAVGGVGGGGGHPRPPPTGTEALMVYKLREFLESRGITSVVPVTHPHDTTEPQLLGMSPEQAEETAAKLRELETDMLLKRQEQVSGMRCCGLILARENDSLPDHLRVWEMTLA